MQKSKRFRLGKALLTGGASEIVRGAKTKKGGRAIKGILSGGLSELHRARRARKNRHFDELVEVESYDPSGSETALSSHMSYDHMNIVDRSLESFLGQPPVKNKMIQYVRMFGYEPSNDPKKLAGQVSFIQDELKKKFAVERRKNFVSEADWKRYLHSGEFDRDAIAGVEELERQKGFAGFDDNETEKFIPLIAGAGAMLAKNKAVRGAIGKVGGKIKALVQKKKLKKQAIAEQNAKAESATTTAQAIQAGVPASTIAQVQSPAVLKEITDVYKGSSVSGTTDAPKEIVAMPEAKLKGKKDNTKMYMLIGGGVVAVILLIVLLKK